MKPIIKIDYKKLEDFNKLITKELIFKKFFSKLILEDYNEEIELIISNVNMPDDYLINKIKIIKEIVNMDQFKIFFEHFKNVQTFKKIPYPKKFIYIILKNLMHTTNPDYDYVYLCFDDFFTLDLIFCETYKYILSLDKNNYCFKQKKIINKHIKNITNSLDKIIKINFDIIKL